MNKKQEILLWISGLILSWWIHLRLDVYCQALWTANFDNIKGNYLDYLYGGGYEKTLFNRLDYVIPFTLQYSIPFLIITGLLFMSLRTRRKK